MSTTVEAILITALVLGIVFALLALIFVWETWVKGSRLDRRIDGFFDRLSDKFFR
ncbi:hypothetical protein H7J88_09155 [Mycolicibacterium flavescens]|uniref:hypothetical protein n=1 Tax=Mycolicibacterium flavescens TaxID=1776 RepID=UPI0013F4EA1E|nr:hypothetical protein [Mycolicibacterium flavescens]MCV7279818.1 hypothetical protein [Mycolicibacterium flavescens]